MRSIIKTGGGGVLPGEIHLDEAFTAQRFKDVSQRPFQLLHVASHFRFSPGTEVNSFLLLGDGQQLTLGDIRTQNYRFDNVDLLTLSACDTGLGGGRDAQGREIEGFGVIAQQQGAKAVPATLWPPVADQSTATLMAEMYQRRQDQHLTKIEALVAGATVTTDTKPIFSPVLLGTIHFDGELKYDAATAIQEVKSALVQIDRSTCLITHENANAFSSFCPQFHWLLPAGLVGAFLGF